MAVDILGLGYKVDTGDIKRAERDLDKFASANKKAAGNVDDLSSQSDKAARTTSSLARSLGTLAAAFITLQAASSLVRIADEYTKFTAQLRLATDSVSQFQAAYGEVVSIARSSQSDIGGLGTLYARITNATREMGLAQGDVAKISETVALSLRVSGASAAESASAMLQLSQAFGSGVLRGEEFNAVNEAAPGLLRALADSIGVPVGALREMASNGELTADVLARAFKDDELLAKLREQAKEVQTISSAIVALRNEFTIYIGELDKSLGVSSSLSKIIIELSENFDLLTRAAVGFAAVYSSNKILNISAEFATFAAQIVNQSRALAISRDAAIADTSAKLASIKAAQAIIPIAQAENALKLASANSSLAAANAQLKAASAVGAYGASLLAVRQAEAAAIASTKARSAALAELAILGQQAARVNAQLTAATAALTAAQNIGAKTASLGARALGLLGGPIGAITTVLSLGATAWALWGGKAKENEDQAVNAVGQSTPVVLTDIEKQVKAIERRNELIRLGVPTTASESQADRLAEIVKQMDEVQRLGTLQGKSIATIEGRQSVLANLGKQFAEVTKAVNAEAAKLAENEKKLQGGKLEEYMAKYATSGEKAAEAIAKAKKELGDLFTPELEKRIRASFIKPTKELTTVTSPKSNETDYLMRQLEEIDKQFDAMWEAEEKRRKDLADAGARIFEQTRTPLEKTNAEFAKLDMLLAQGAIDWDTYARATLDATDALDDVRDTGTTTLEDLKFAIEGFSREASNAFIDFAVTGKASIGDLVESTLTQFARLQAQKQIFDPLFKAGSDFIESSNIGSTIGNFFSGLLPGFSNGGFVSGQGTSTSDSVNARLSAGEFVMSASAVNRAGRGTMEAINRGQSVGSNVVVNVINQPGQTARVQETNNGGVRQLDVIIDQVQSAIAGDISKGRGAVNTALTTQFGLNRAAGALR